MMHEFTTNWPAAAVCARPAITASIVPAHNASRLAWAAHSDASSETYDATQTKDPTMFSTSAVQGLFTNLRNSVLELTLFMSMPLSGRQPLTAIAIWIPALVKYWAALALWKPHQAPRAFVCLSSTFVTTLAPAPTAPPTTAPAARAATFFACFFVFSASEGRTRTNLASRLSCACSELAAPELAPRTGSTDAKSTTTTEALANAMSIKGRC
mmetsp:Transcript_134121/g.428540  ORF Transcript_134121/g.428540 Transcript_134121/m.428540 type:complete len:212 (+) Transcript_134121:824-1459(+)